MGRERKGTCQPQTPAHIHLAPACGICLQILQNAIVGSGGEWGADVGSGSCQLLIIYHLGCGANTRSTVAACLTSFFDKAPCGAL